MNGQIQDFDSPHILGKRTKGGGTHYADNYDGNGGYGGYERGNRQDDGWRGGNRSGGWQGGRWRGGRLRKRRILVFFSVVALLLAAIILFLTLYQPLNVVLKKRTLYLLILHRADTIATAKDYSQEVAAAGGAGLIVNDGEFLVTAFVYKSKSDAEGVKTRMQDGYINAEIKTLTYKKLKIRRFGSRANEKNLKNLLSYPFELMDNLIRLIYDLDSFEATESGTLLAADRLKDTLKTRAEQAKMLSNSYSNLTQATHLIAFFEEALEAFEQTAILTSDGQKLTGRLKKLACSLAISYQEFWQIC